MIIGNCLISICPKRSNKDTNSEYQCFSHPTVPKLLGKIIPRIDHRKGVGGTGLHRGFESSCGKRFIKENMPRESKEADNINYRGRHKTQQLQHSLSP